MRVENEQKTGIMRCESGKDKQGEAEDKGELLRGRATPAAGERGQAKILVQGEMQIEEEGGGPQERHKTQGHENQVEGQSQRTDGAGIPR